MKHALQCVARLVRALLGQSAIAEKKLACGKKLDILGIMVDLSRNGFKCRPTQQKAHAWQASLQEGLAHLLIALGLRASCQAALDNNRLRPGDASKLAGKLSWGGANMFRKLGRAMLRPIFDQKTRRDGQLNPELRGALQWWIEVLQRRLAERRSWESSGQQPIHLFCDASGSPPHLGAVLLHEDGCFYTHLKPGGKLLSMFKPRKDNQIMGLELLSISLGMATFEHLMAGRNTIVHSDNTGSESAFRRGTAVSYDHAQLVHAQWTHAAQKNISMWVKRVSTDDNIADLPSRDEFGVLQAVGATYCEPALHETAWMPETWAILKQRWKL